MPASRKSSTQQSSALLLQNLRTSRTRRPATSIAAGFLSLEAAVALRSRGGAIRGVEEEVNPK